MIWVVAIIAGGLVLSVLCSGAHGRAMRAIK